MLPLGSNRFVDLRIFNGDAPVNGLTQTNLTIIFNRDGRPCSDLLGLSPTGQGRYQLGYTPSAAGHDYIEVGYTPTNFLFTSSEDIVDLGAILAPVLTSLLTSALTSNNVVFITQDFGGTGALKATVSNPSSYTLYVYNSSDWISGNTDTSQSVDSTALDAQGNWVDSPLVILHGTYHFILRNSSGSVIVFKPNLVV